MNRATSTARTRTPAAHRTEPESRARDPRPGAVPSPEMVNLFEEALAAPPVPAKTRRATDDATSRLLATAWVSNVAYDKRVWLDLELLSQAGKPVHAETLPLGYVEPAGGAGDFFRADVPIPEPATRDRRRAACSLQYRLYYEVNGQVFTDGVLHQRPLSE